MIIPTISGAELCGQLEAGRPAWLIHAPGPLDLRWAHIPGAVAFNDDELVAAVLTLGEEIVVYGHDADCADSRRLVAALLRRGYRRTRWYEGGLQDWVARGGRVEGASPGGAFSRWPRTVGGENHGPAAQEELVSFEASYTAETGQRLPDDRFAFGDEPAMADELAALVLAGTKRATAALLADLGHRDDDLPQVGDRAVVLDGTHRPVCVIETRQISVVAFSEVDATFAWDEGEGDRTLRYWRDEHERFFRARCDALDIEFTPQLEVVCERFEVVWAAEDPSTPGARL